ncbi:hypothetical protein QYE76_062585 [Lolium multiflorum]|uniref:Uncharacterized protein n=1 Tax=Lolium multiflorum TaxID=4521 RepID=A0AAD8W7E0_LOLMU|nr:hypothetical protein QYE76_062585 [Lolium multiflorum]
MRRPSSSYERLSRRLMKKASTYAGYRDAGGDPLLLREVEVVVVRDGRRRAYGTGGTGTPRRLGSEAGTR